MADITLADLRNRVLQKLSVLMGGETAAAEDAAVVDAACLAVFEDLRERNICYWSDSAIPLALKESLAEHIACYSCGDFPSKKNNAKYGGEAAKEATRAVLRELTAHTKRVETPTQAAYF
jgi:hypothetical protein